jgi:hypothetical protein
MIDAIVGAVIMVVATTSLVYAIEVSVKAFDEAGRYDLNSSEKQLLRGVGLVDEAGWDSFYEKNIHKSRMQWGKSSDE